MADRYQTKTVANVTGGADNTYNYYAEPQFDKSSQLTEDNEIVLQFILYGGTGVGAKTGCTLTVAGTIRDDGTLPEDMAATDWEDISALVLDSSSKIAAPTETTTGLVIDNNSRIMLTLRYLRFTIVADPNDTGTCNWKIEVRTRVPI
jgi:hypothetical protein